MANPLYGNVVWVPSDRTGATNMATELEAFVRANQPNVVTVAPGSIIKLRGFGQQGTLLSTDHVKVDFSDCLVLYDDDSRAVDLDNTDNASAEVTVSSIVNGEINSYTPTSEITLAATLSAEAHDWIAIYSEDANPSKSGGKLGEIKQLIQDEASLVLRTTKRIQRTSLWTTTIRARKLSATAEVWLNGGSWMGDGDVDDDTIVTRNRCINVQGYVSPVVQNMRCRKPWAQFIMFVCCADYRSTNISMKDSLNVVTNSAQGYTYGVTAYGMNAGGSATNMHLRNCRHPAGSSDGNSGNTTTWHQKGYPTDCVWQDIVGWNCYGGLTDSHEEGAHLVFKNITSFWPVQDAAQTLGITHQSRSFNETIENVTCIGGTGGIRVSNVNHGVQNKVIIRNITGRYIQADATNHDTYFIDLQNRDSGGTDDGLVVVLDNVHGSGCDRFIRTGRKVKLRFKDCHATGCLWYMDVGAGAEVYGSGMVSDHTHSPHSGSRQYVVVLRSEAGLQPKFIMLDSPVVIQNTTDEPREFFQEQDTTDTKLVYHPGITLYQPNGGTAMVEREAGETTIDNATGISTVALGA